MSQKVGLTSTANENGVRPRGSAPRRALAVLSTWPLEPADNGRKQRTRRMIDALAQDFDITLITLTPPSDLPVSQAASPNVAHVHALAMPHEPSSTPLKIGKTLHRYPRSQVELWCASTADRIASIVARSGAEAVIGTDLRSVRYLAALPEDVCTILDEPDVSWIVEEARGVRPRSRALAKKTRWLLSDVAGRLDGVIVASQLEADAYLTFAPRPLPVVIENAVGGLPARTWTPHEGDSLVFTGSITYQPNYDAVRFIRQQVLPLLAGRNIAMNAVVTGALPAGGPPPELSSPRIHFTGRLPDLEETLLNAQIFVCPLFDGTGTRVKLLEAMAYGLPIISTRKGAEGLVVRDEHHLIFADTPAEFARAIVKLRNHPRLCRVLGRNARSLVADRYTWDVQGSQLRTFVSETLAVQQRS